MTLTSEDMGEGWLKGTPGAPPQPGALSVSHIYYSQGSAFTPVVQNSVAVFRSVAVAQDTYNREKPTNVTLKYPDIGDECFLNDSVAINKLLVFRKANVVVWVWLKQYQSGDIEQYARIVEGKIKP